MGTLDGCRVIEFAGLGPAPYAAMLLGDLGADIVRVDRPGGGAAPVVERRHETMLRNRRSLILDLRTPRGLQIAQELVEGADVVIEGYRPGVMERLGLGPDECLARNPGLVYGRMTGWGQDGPLGSAAGHDINYVALTGALAAIGSGDRPPVPPLALLGDMAGGGLTLAFGIVAALVERARSGEGQVVDAAIVDGVLSLMTPFYGFHAAGAWNDQRESNRLDGGAPFYRVYECADGKYVSVGPLEPAFFAQLIDLLELSADDFAERMDPNNWKMHHDLLEAKFRTRGRDEWCEILGKTDACVAPVLTMSEAPNHPHLREREAFVAMGGERVPAPAPRFSRTPSAIRRPPVRAGNDTSDVLDELGYSHTSIDELRREGIVS